MRSPKLAAMGVATLSGLIPVFFEPTITPTMMIPEYDIKRISTLLTAVTLQETEHVLKRPDVKQQHHHRVTVCVFTLQQGGYEGRGHAAGAQQHSVAHLKLPLWNPTKNHGCYGRQETHNSGLNLGQRGRRWSRLINDTKRALAATCARPFFPDNSW